jgi:hypothetical protein
MTKVITIDMDGTLYDPWACCGHRDDSKTGSEKCRHIRHDILREINNTIAQHPDALIAVLSWRSDNAVEPTRKWLTEHVGLTPDFIFMPYSPDEEEHIRVLDPWHGQVHFKKETVRILHEQGYQVIASWDDNRDVIRALRDEGIFHARVAPHRVHIGRTSWTRGWMPGHQPDHLNDDGKWWDDALSKAEHWWDDDEYHQQALAFAASEDARERRLHELTDDEYYFAIENGTYE